ncbi:MAG: ThuA domain-containing protein [Verrucomicrobiota bacterium]
MSRLLVVSFLCFVLHASAADAPRVVLISGEFEYSSMITLPALKEYLEKQHGFDCTYLERTGGQDIPGLDALDKADLAIVIIRRMTLPDDQLNRFRKYLDSGRPLIGLRTASHAFENWKSWDKEVLGGNYQGHHGNAAVATASLIPEAARHPILSGVAASFVTGGSLYKNTPLAPAARPLLTAKIENHPAEPVAWTHEYKGARIFYSSLGDEKDFASQPFMQLLVNAIHWSLNRPAPKQPARAIATFPPRKITLDQFEPLAGHRKFTVLDVRTPDEFKNGRIARAVNLDVNAPDFAERAAKLDKDAPIAVHCQSGRRAGIACEKLHELGFKFVYHFEGSLGAWQKAGKKVEK